MNSNNWTLSVIVCINSNNPYMGEALASLAAAVVNLPIEKVLVANGGYRPDPEIEAFFDKVISVDIGGLGYARNRGVESCGGRYITFFDADDLVTREYFSQILDMIQSKGFEEHRYAFSATANIDAGGQPLKSSLINRIDRNPARSVWMRHPFTGATLVIARADFVRIGGYKWGGYAEDYEFTIRLRRAFGNPIFLRDNFYIYRIHSAAMSSDKVKKVRGVMAVQATALLGGNGLSFLAGFFINVARLMVAVWPLKRSH